MSHVIRSLLPAKAPEGLTQDQREIWDFMEDLKLTLLRKNTDYGSSVFQPPIVAPHVSPTDAILVRISDKLKRLIHLSSHKELVKEETIHDTAMDASAYFALLCIAMTRSTSSPTTEKQEATPVTAPRVAIVSTVDAKQQPVYRGHWVRATKLTWNGTERLIEGKVLDIVRDPQQNVTHTYVQVSKYLIPNYDVEVIPPPEYAEGGK